MHASRESACRRLVAGVGYSPASTDRAVRWTHDLGPDLGGTDPSRMAGAPTVRSTRVTVSAVLGQLAAGRTIEQLLVDYPYLERDDVLAVLAFASENVQRELPFVAA